MNNQSERISSFWSQKLNHAEEYTLEQKDANMHLKKLYSLTERMHKGNSGKGRKT
jgi:hypothetical protein